MKPDPFELLNYLTLPSILVHAIGLETGTASQDYIQLYNGDAKLLLDCLERVRSAASQILDGIGDWTDGAGTAHSLC
jgi:hypothetical protein